MTSRTPRYEVVINHIGIPCMTMQECRDIADNDDTRTARIYRRTRTGYDDVTPKDAPREHTHEGERS